ncbi:hypothetical protein O3G_MSEX010552 [Manduca sexta]|uniref:Uncharacterized protein n=2 Tax=Manduca sexta TaxID=7130 RepID=A0A922CTM1_MANSE|nr:hypothetical protein O3G_MSEX010552 [Manduca sexta]
MTRPLTFQTSGCLASNTTPLRIVDATPMFDLSPIYGNVLESARRTFTNGTLRTEIVDGAVFPPTTGVNVALSETFVGTILFWRFHNHIAQKLFEVNPCWTDDEIFVAAREINIACGSQILYYELMATIMGAHNLIADEVLLNSSESYGFRDIYDETEVPRMSMEFPAVLRWMHKLQAGLLNFYDANGVYLNETFPMVNVNSNSAFLKKEGRMAYVTQGCFRQPSGRVNDHAVDSDLLNFGLGRYQRANDILTNDLAKTRHFGMPSYIHYRSYCFGDKISSFNQLKGIISNEGIEALKSKYSCVEDIDLLAGVWMEELMDNAFVPPTFYCIVKEQLLHNVKSDRHWYERADRPNAFSEAELGEIRKITASRMLCDVGDSVTEIQPRAFELPGEGNEIVSCDVIPNIDYTKWADSRCTPYSSSTQAN